ncbi:helix-turn-helix domain-containing protein [Streptacidiphilus jiangxiensis]|uniref:Helix-turn-helix domain-containing protein n=1 Tax=Streptacidiphilus jiangxiensis TaxID=235985 RepID=A0A1H7I6S1_STRJI|nr:helix-turn-helix domain-containing protein [Streptacidiphilus jiangxiensis]SEK58138.1 hypothetical protein SAMN05414137_102524 [Streptacidiphilus jiangxiensis]
MTPDNGADEGIRTRRAAIEEFVEGLRLLRLEAGQPAFRAMAKSSGKVSHATLHDALSGARLPTWPTVAAFVQACGGDLAFWRQRWLDAAEVARPEPECEGERAEPLAHPLPGSSAPEPPAPAQTHELSVGRAGRVRTFLVGALVGAVVGAGVAVGVTTALGDGATPVVCPTSDADLAAGAAAVQPPKVVPAAYAESASAATTPSWVGRPASDAQILTVPGVSLPVVRQVTAGDALVVSLMLTSTCPGPVRVTDTLGDSYSVAVDDTDTARHRTMIFVAFGVRPLTDADAIHVTYPHASKYHIDVEEFRGVSAVTAHGHAHGEVGSAAFSTGADPVECRAGELMVAAVGSNTGPAPTLVTGWTKLADLKLSSYHLITAYQIAPTDGRCAATGTTTAQWGVDLAVLR